MSLWYDLTWDWTQVSRASIVDKCLFDISWFNIKYFIGWRDLFYTIYIFIYICIMCIYNFLWIYYYYYYYYYFTPSEFFILAGGLSLEFEWQQVSLALQDSSKYSGWSQQCCSLHGLDSSTDFLFFQSFFPFLCGLILVHQLHQVLSSPSCSTGFLVLWQGPSICLSFCYISFSLSGPLGRQNPLYSKSSFFINYH